MTPSSTNRQVISATGSTSQFSPSTSRPLNSATASDPPLPSSHQASGGGGSGADSQPLNPQTPTTSIDALLSLVARTDTSPIPPPRCSPLLRARIHWEQC